MVRGGEQLPFSINPANFDNLLIRKSKSNIFSAPFDIRSMGKMWVRYDDSLVEESERTLYRVGKVLKSPNIFISFTETKSWPYLIQNSTDISVTVNQKVSLV